MPLQRNILEQELKKKILDTLNKPINSSMGDSEVKDRLSSDMASAIVDTIDEAIVWGVDNIYIAVYGETTAIEINKAIEDGKFVIVVNEKQYFLYSNDSGEAYEFVRVEESSNFVASINKAANTWRIKETHLIESDDSPKTVTTTPPSELSNNEEIPTSKAVYTSIKGVSMGLSNKEDKANKVRSISSLSTDEEYPSAKCVYDIVGDIEILLASL